MISAFTGNIGTGKTCWMTAYGFLLHGASGFPAFANYAVRYAERLTSLEQLFDTRKGIVLLDELPTLADSRSFAQKNVKQLTQFLAQTRKAGLTVLYTTQYIHQVDKRVRAFTDSLVVCRKRGNRGQYRTQMDFYVPTFAEDTYAKVGSKSVRHDPFWYSLYDTWERVEVLE